MKQLLKKFAIIFGIVSIVVPIVMVSLWYKYVREQESLYGNEIASKQPCEPYAMMTTRDPQGKLSITWQTKDTCPGFVLLGVMYTDFTNLPYKVLSAQGETPTASHTVTILKQDELKYRYAVIVSSGEWYGINGNPFEYR